MINGQDALLAVAFTLKKEARPEREVASDVSRIINISYAELQRLHDNEDAIARAEAMGDYERASRLTRELLEA